jgi:chemotaxis protein MotB
LRRSGGGGEGGGGHDGAGSMRWLLTYADLITLLMVFFVVLYSMSRVDQAKYLALALSLRSSFTAEKSGDAVIQTSIAPADVPDMLPQQRELQDLRQKLYAELKRAGVADQVDLTQTNRGLDIGFSEEAAFFEAGRARLLPRFVDVLHRLAPALASVPNSIEVDGSTDDLPLHSPKYTDSWQLSSRRATNVVEELILLGIDPHRVSAVAFGEYHPRYPNDNLADREKNRRVDIVILNTPQAGTAKPAPLGTSPIASVGPLTATPVRSATG